MIKLASVALTSFLGVAGVLASRPAAAHPYVTVGIVTQPYCVGAQGRYWHPDYERFRYYERYRYEHRRWDHDWDHHGDRDWDRRGYRR